MTTPQWKRVGADAWQTTRESNLADPEQEASVEVQDDGSVQVICWWRSGTDDATGTAIPLVTLEHIVRRARRLRTAHLLYEAAELGTARCE